MGYKTLAVSSETYERLAKEGKWGDSMDSIISRVLDAAKKQEPQTMEAITQK